MAAHSVGMLPLKATAAFTANLMAPRLTALLKPAGAQLAALQPPRCQGVGSTLRQQQLMCSAAEVTSVEGEAVAASAPEITKMDIRVGQILSAERHPDADSLYVEQIDVGEEEPRTIVSGLVKYVPLEELQGRRVVVLCNLKARNMRGIKSHGMLLCASDAAHENVEPLAAPEGAAVGERVFFGEEGQQQPEPAKENQVQKKKIWEAVQPDLKTDTKRVAGYQGLPMLTSAGPITAPTLPGANIS